MSAWLWMRVFFAICEKFLFASAIIFSNLETGRYAVTLYQLISLCWYKSVCLRKVWVCVHSLCSLPGVAYSDYCLSARWKSSWRSASRERERCSDSSTDLLSACSSGITSDSRRELLWRWYAVKPAMLTGKLIGSKVHERFESTMYRNQIVYIRYIPEQKGFYIRCI
jgi:hypothetical protein